jgi:hypothetical protein
MLGVLQRETGRTVRGRRFGGGGAEWKDLEGMAEGGIMGRGQEEQGLGVVV